MNDMSHAEGFEHYDSLPTNVETPGVIFTYSHPGQSRLRRGLIRAVEAISGRRRFERLYHDWRGDPRNLEGSVFSSAVARLGFQVEVTRGDLSTIPETGGLLVVANHPFGIVDGLSLGHLISQRRGDVKLMVHSLLAQPPEARDILLPVDFSGTAAARRHSAQTRKDAQDWLDQGHCLIIFPAGGISTAPRPWSRRVADAAWHPFVARLAARAGVTTLPVFVEGQNSRLFQIVSHFSYPLRVALIFRETKARMGKRIAMALGQPMDCSKMPRDEVTPALRAACMGLGGRNPQEEFIYPARLRF